MRDGSFLRLKQLEIGYTIPDDSLANPWKNTDISQFLYP